MYSQSLQIFENTPLKDNPEIRNETPSASKISRHDNMSINEYLGIPNISFPLCNMELADINIPISISYQATGIKVNQDASCVGLGWDLNTLGSIVQVIRGDDDFNPYHMDSHDFYKLLPDYYSSNYADFEDLPEYGYDSRFNINTNGYPIETVKEKYGYRKVFRDYFPINGKLVYNERFRFSNTYWDSEPDVFIINILGEKLHCITSDFSKNITKNGKSYYVTVLNKTGYKVEKISLLDRDSWIVTNPEGTRFFFDLKHSSVSKTYSHVSMYGISGESSDSSENRSSNTWYLTKIETALGTIIDLLYESTEKVKFITLGNGAIEYITSDSQHNYDPGYPPQFLTNIFLSKTPITYSTTESITEESQYILTQIRSKKCNIKFNYTTREDILKYKKLDNIIFSYEGEKAAKTIAFAYNHIENLKAEKRMILEALNINGELYNFQYNQIKLPPRNSFAQDYWGYYNGNLNNNSLVPNPKRFGHTLKQDLEQYYDPIINNMSANLEYTKAGTLTKVIYPTKGFVEFDYELNTFKNFWVPSYTNSDKSKNASSEGFGLRIKSILYKDSDSRTFKKERYEYYGGKSVASHRFDKDGRIEWLNSPLPHYLSSAGFIAMSTSSLSDINPFSTHTGIGYDSVSCIFESVIDNKKFKTTTIYHNRPHYSSAYQPITRNLLHTIHMPSFENSDYPKNGSIEEKRYYNDLGRLVRKEEYQYENKKSTIYYGVKLMKIQDVYQQPSAGGAPYQPGISRYLLGYYPVFDFESLLSSKVEIDYTQNGTVSAEQIYKYDDKRRLQEINSISSKGDHLSKKIVYDTYWNSKNIFSHIKEENFFSENNLLKYRKVDYNTQSPTIKRIIEGSELTSPAKSIEYDYVEYNRPMRVLVNQKDATIYLWTYSGLYPIAEIKNSTIDKVENAVKSAFGVTSIYALWNLDFKESEHATLENKLQALRGHNSLKDAIVTTYTFRPLVGMLTATNPSGITSYYDYNNMGQLISTKNNQKEMQQALSYNYIGSSLPQKMEIKGDSVCYISKGDVYKANILGSSGLFIYNWVMKKESGEMILNKTGNSPEFSIHPKEYGPYIIECQIENIAKDIYATKKIIAKGTVSFTDVSTPSNSPCNYKDIIANISADKACSISFTCEVSGTTSNLGHPKAEITIGNQTSSYYGYNGKYKYDIVKNVPAGKTPIKIRIYNVGYQAQANLGFNTTTDPYIEFGGAPLFVINFCSKITQ